jgi:excinuclease ABC subunit C
LTEQNDYAALQEIIRRRYRNGVDVDLILIDGGKGQLSAAVQVLPADACVISLAKREETIFSKQFPEGVKLDMQTDVGRLLIAVRDYAHHFAISYHRLLRNKNTF